jgi:NTE family protein
MKMKTKRHNCLVPILLITVVVGYGCAHYPVNQPLAAAKSEWTRAKETDEIAVLLAFSGGGTRAAAFSYGVLEELADTKVTIKGTERRLLDEVAVISSVSGGSFTAAYYGLFGDRIFTDFETKFLKKNVQSDLISRAFFNPVSWIRFASPYFDRSDLAAEYYDEHIFEKGTFGDMARRGGPGILINATDMVSGLRVDFTTEMFDLICSDLMNYPVARAVAASSAVPGVLTPITLRNYAGTCNYKPPQSMETIPDTADITDRRSWILKNAIPFLDSNRKKYVHLLDGGIADNLGLRAIMDRIALSEGKFAKSMEGTPVEYLKNMNKFVFIIVNAQTEPGSSWDRKGSTPTKDAVIDSYSTIAIARYNIETLALWRESIKGWSDQLRALRCTNGQQPDNRSCEDIQFYVIYINFEALRDEKEREYFNQIPTSFHLEPEQIDKLRAAARKILRQSKEFERFLNDSRK